MEAEAEIFSSWKASTGWRIFDEDVRRNNTVLPWLRTNKTWLREDGWLIFSIPRAHHSFRLQRIKIQPLRRRCASY
jgi:hypothetical protein